MWETYNLRKPLKVSGTLYCLVGLLALGAWLAAGWIWRVADVPVPRATLFQRLKVDEHGNIIEPNAELLHSGRCYVILRLRIPHRRWSCATQQPGRNTHWIGAPRPRELHRGRTH